MANKHIRGSTSHRMTRDLHTKNQHTNTPNVDSGLRKGEPLECTQARRDCCCHAALWSPYIYTYNIFIALLYLCASESSDDHTSPFPTPFLPLYILDLVVIYYSITRIRTVYQKQMRGKRYKKSELTIQQFCGRAAASKKPERTIYNPLGRIII